MLEVDQVFIVTVDAHVSVRAPSSLDLLGSQGVLRFELDLLLPLDVASPSPLNLDSSYVVHGEAMVFEQPPSQTHLVSCLDDGSAVVSQALVLILVHHVELGGEELLPQLL